MVRPLKGDVVVVPFPFSGASGDKVRPAMVITSLLGDDVILCMITSQRRPEDRYSIPITSNDFADGGLKHDSFVRPNRLFTGNSQKIERKVGKLKPEFVEKVITAIVQIIRS